MTGTRLGIICETVSMLSFGLLLGSLFSGQLTLIVLLSVIIFFAMAGAKIVGLSEVARCNSLITDKANAVRGNDLL